MVVFMHLRNATDPKDKTILRPNFDTLYSSVVVDLKSSASITLPGSDRLQILKVVSAEHWIPKVTSNPGVYEIIEELVGRRYAFIIIRTQVSMQHPADIKQVGAIQDKKICQENRGEFVELKIGIGVKCLQ